MNIKAVIGAFVSIVLYTIFVGILGRKKGVQ